MHKLFRLTATLATAVLLAFSLACSDASSTTGPTSDEHPAIPQFATAACAVWSCSIGDCQQDPALYGACCVEAASAEYPATGAPSCDGPPPPHGYADWCGTTAHAGCLIKRAEDMSYTQDCSIYDYANNLTSEDIFTECQP